MGSQDVSTLVKELAGVADSMASAAALKNTESEVNAMKTLLAEVSASLFAVQKELAASVEKMDQQTYSLGGHLKMAKEEIAEVKGMVTPLSDFIQSIQNIKPEEPVAVEEPVEPVVEEVAEPEPAAEEPVAEVELEPVAEPEAEPVVEEPAAVEAQEE